MTDVCPHKYRRISTYDKDGCIENQEESWEEARARMLRRKKAGRRMEMFTIVEWCMTCDAKLRREDI